MAMKRLIEIGYPSELAKFEYDPNFAVRYIQLNWFFYGH